MVERMNKSFEELKKENKSLRKVHEKMKAEVQQRRMDMSTPKEKAISSEISAEVHKEDETEVRKVIQFLEVDVTEGDMKIKTIPSSRPLKPFVVSFADDNIRNLVLTNRRSKESRISKEQFVAYTLTRIYQRRSKNYSERE
ncbi:hypothetical protein HHI36_017339 [Cryptolaemus montrouzieri]|uniref:Uncharacterized protein n=1 Tax=Cryptolaemus montrouzieri TaxID=559131 RepID=A0ABD2NMJ3_9CUCU